VISCRECSNRKNGKERDTAPIETSKKISAGCCPARVIAFLDKHNNAAGNSTDHPSYISPY
jgi:hypothetical protein